MGLANRRRPLKSCTPPGAPKMLHATYQPSPLLHLRAAKVAVHVVTGPLDQAPRGQHDLRVVPAKLNEQGPVARARGEVLCLVALVLRARTGRREVDADSIDGIKARADAAARGGCDRGAAVSSKPPAVACASPCGSAHPPGRRGGCAAWACKPPPHPGCGTACGRGAPTAGGHGAGGGGGVSGRAPSWRIAVHAAADLRCLSPDPPWAPHGT